MTQRRLSLAMTLVAATALTLAGCSSGGETTGLESPPTDESYYPVTVTDMAGNEVTIESAESVALTDNRFFQLAADWDVPVSVAPQDLMSPNNPLETDESVLNLGLHVEPDFEQLVVADPDVIINGYRFGGEGNAEGVRDAAPEVPFIDMNNDELSAEEYVVESVSLFGEIFDKEAEAQALIDEFEHSIQEAEQAYDSNDTVMGLVTSGGEINYSNPEDGRGASVFFSLLDLTPALDTEGSADHTGDSVSLEALAEAQADFFMVLDRDAAVGEGDVTPATDLINSSAALKNVPAVKNEAIYVFPDDYYLTEDIFAYTTVLNGLSELFQNS